MYQEKKTDQDRFQERFENLITAFGTNTSMAPCDITDICLLVIARMNIALHEDPRQGLEHLMDHCNALFYYDCRPTVH